MTRPNHRNHDLHPSRATSSRTTATQPVAAPQPTLSTLEQLIKQEPALTAGGVRHLLFTKGHDLPGVYRFGRKLLFNRTEFIAGIMAGHAAKIAGVQK
ncbi:MAG: hypothetical protein B7Y07_02410 [Halothiobacillus sp. 24-54-40]|jgi:hypothetical protein|nr:MAG: hypothetical protein B7Y58_10740 [Halothiobacillus sp. 35-54-62]OYZ87998.1 MAG: hypothetical protein B7Y07_02410 [Halothiobacillus sp. 24-54-40]OZA78902.1 MAG: hypothetical protein B7X64_11835 [Halothiobacillus sp. 39-53-45]